MELFIAWFMSKFLILIIRLCDALLKSNALLFNRFIRSYILVASLVLLSSCTTFKMIFLNIASVNDLKHFHYKEIAPNNPSNPFIISHNFKIPNIDAWMTAKNNIPQLNQENFLKKTNTTAFIIVRNDTILYEYHDPSYPNDRPEIIFSLTKVFVTTLLEIAIEEGYIKSIDQKVSDFLPEFGTSGRENFKLKDVLNMTSGLNYDDYGKILKTMKLYYSNDLTKIVSNAKLHPDHQMRFVYKSMDTQILGMCIEKATGRKISDYLQEKIWTPLNMEQKSFFTEDRKDGEQRMFGGMAASSRDLMKLARLYLQKGKWNGKQLISAIWIANIRDKKTENDKWWGYTAGWWLDTSFDDDFLASTDFFSAGYKGQCLYINPDNNLIILRKGKNRGGINWSSSIGQLARIMTTKDSTERVYPTPNDFLGSYPHGKDTLVVSHHKNVWTMHLKSENNTKLVINLQLYSKLSLYNHGKRIKLLFKMQSNKIIGLYYDDYSPNPVFYGKNVF